MRPRRHFGALVTASALVASGVLIAGGQRALPWLPAAAPAATAVPLPSASFVAAQPASRPAVVVAAPVGRPVLPGQIRQLVQGGCCAGAWWAEDSSALQFIDRPDEASGTAIFAVPLWPPGAGARVVDSGFSQRSGALPLVVRPDVDYSWVEDLGTGDRWPLPTGGNPVRLSPDGSRAVWWEAVDGQAHNDSLIRVFSSDIYGFDQRELGGMWGLDVIAFLPDNRRVVVVGRPMRTRADYALLTLDAVDGRMTQLAAGRWLSDAAVSRDGSHVAYIISLDRDAPDENGVWIVPTAGGPPVRQDFFGAYRWRDGNRLLYIPMAPGQGAHQVWELDVTSGARRLVVDPAAMPIRVAGNDWSVSPDGQSLAFLSEDDRNLWVIDLPR